MGGAVLLCLGLATGCEQLLGLDEHARRIDPNAGLEQCASGCDDDNPCTVDACDVAVGVCRHTATADGPAPKLQQVTGDCREVACTAGDAQSLRDDEDVPVDTACGIGACVDARATLLPMERGVSCNVGGQFCDGEGACVECLSDTHCEQPSTCGGGPLTATCGCTPDDCTVAGLTCGSASDGCYGELICDNLTQNGDETDVDCGGVLAGCGRRCEAGLSCRYGTDCVTSFCAGDTCDGAWSLRAGDEAAQRVRAVAVDAAGNTVVTGEFMGEVDFGNGPRASPPGSWSIFVVKFSPAGIPAWTRVFSNVSAVPTVNDVVVDGSGSIIMAGNFLGTMDWSGQPLISGQLPQGFVVVLNDQGYPVWSEQLSGGSGSSSSSDATALALGAAGTVVVAGHYEGTLNVGTLELTSVAGRDTFLAKLNSAGTPIFARSYGGTGHQRATGVAVDSSGDIALVGEYTGGVDFGGGEHISNGDWDAFAARLDETGGYHWSQSFGETAPQRAAAVAFDVLGNVLVAGSFFGAIDLQDGNGPQASVGADDLFVVKLDQSGATTWGKRYGDVQSQQVAAMVVDGTATVVAGSFNGVVSFGTQLPLVSNGGPDVFIAKLDRDGGAVWSRRFGDALTQRASDLAVTETGSLLLVGNFHGSIDFGQGNFISAGVEDIFIAALPPQ